MAGADSAAPSRRGLFVGGCPRSGTSLLHQILNGHARIALGLERYNLLCFEERLAPDHFAEARFRTVMPGDTWYDSTDRFGDIYDPILARYGAAAYVGDKIPRSFRHFAALSRLFPDTRFLVSFRDVHSVARSFEARHAAETEWRPDWDYRAAVEMWNASIAETLHWMTYLPILPVMYDDMTAGGGLAERLGAFLELHPGPFARAIAEARQLQRTPPADLSPEALDHIDRHADHEGYRRIAELAASPPLYQKYTENRAIGPARVDKYSKDDQSAFDYQGWQKPECPYVFRGPRPRARVEDSVAFIGSAATFGRFAERPFPALLEERIGLPVINLGIGGARARTYLDDRYCGSVLRRCRAVVVEAMSARGYRSSIFVPNNAHSNVGLPLDDPDGAVVRLYGDGAFIDAAWEAALCRGANYQRLVAEVRSAAIRDMRAIAGKVRGKAILFYISQREPGYVGEPSSFGALSGGFPHFVDQAMLDLLAPEFVACASLVSREGLPQPVLDRETGAPASIHGGSAEPGVNIYYPSPRMHVLAADILEPLLRTLTGIGRG